MHLGRLGWTPSAAEISAQNTANKTVLKRSSCMNAGGYWDGYVCKLPPAPVQQAAPAPAPANITVSPQIQTQISPQISPVFQQQFQPENSPMAAGTTQTTAPAPGVTGQSQLPPAPAPVQAAAPSYTPPPPQYSAPPPAALPAAPALYGSESAPAASAPPLAPAPAGIDWKIPAMIAAGLFGFLALSSDRKRK